MLYAENLSACSEFPLQCIERYNVLWELSEKFSSNKIWHMIRTSIQHKCGNASNPGHMDSIKHGGELENGSFGFSAGIDCCYDHCRRRGLRYYYAFLSMVIWPESCTLQERIGTKWRKWRPRQFYSELIGCPNRSQTIVRLCITFARFLIRNVRYYITITTDTYRKTVLWEESEKSQPQIMSSFCIALLHHCQIMLILSQLSYFQHFVTLLSRKGSWCFTGIRRLFIGMTDVNKSCQFLENESGFTASSYCVVFVLVISTLLADAGTNAVTEQRCSRMWGTKHRVLMMILY